MLFRSIDGRNWHRSTSALSLALQNLLNTLNFPLIPLTRNDLAIRAGANTDVRCDPRYAVGMNCGMAIVDGLGDL